MSSIKRIIIGEATEDAIKALFDSRIRQESSEGSMNMSRRQLDISHLKTQVLSYIKNNPNAKFELVVPELKIGKTVKMVFTNYASFDEDNDPISTFTLTINDEFDKCVIVQKADIGKDIELVLTVRK